MVAEPFPNAISPACASLGTFVRLEETAITLNVTGNWATEGAVTVTAAAPRDAGKRTNTSATPALSVVSVVVESCTPGDPWKLTRTPATGEFDASSRPTR